MVNGLKTVTKQRTDEGLKLLMLAMLPVPKNADNSRNIYRDSTLSGILRDIMNAIQTIDVINVF